MIDDARARKMAQDLNGDYIETCATYGMNIDRVFSDATLKILRQRQCNQPTIPNSTPLGGANRSAKNSSTPLRNQVQRHHAADPNESSDGSTNQTPSQNRKPPNRRKSGRTGLFSRRSGTDDRKNGAVRRQIIKEGWILKKSHSIQPTKKKYLTLSEDGLLTYYSSLNDFVDDRDKKSLEVVRTTIKVPGRSGQPIKGKNSTFIFSESSKIHLGDHDYDFTVVSSSGDNWVFSCETADDRDSWVEIIENMIKTR